MDTSRHDASQPGSHRNSLNQHQFAQYPPPGHFDTLSPRFEDIKQEPGLSPPHENPHPTHQFGDYPLYPPDDFAYGNTIATSGASINPAALTLMEGNSGHATGHHRTPSLQLEPPPEDHDSPGHQQAYLSASSTQPSTGGYEWASVFARSEEEQWGHRRAPSEYSDISSAAPSPYLGNEEFGGAPSPLLEAQYSGQGSMQDLLNSSDSFGMEAFTLSDRGDPSPRLSSAPGFTHSGANSPYLMPQDSQNLNLIPTMPGVGGTGMHPMGPPPAGHGAGPPQGLGIGEDTFAPRIDISFAPPQRQPTFPGKGVMLDSDTLSPPPKCMCHDNALGTVLTIVAPRGQRQRSKSDPYANGSGGAITRPMNSQPGSRGTSPVRGRPRQNSLSPNDAERATSTSSTRMSRRSSTNSMPDRGYILGLAHPDRPGSTPGDNKRVQKHPATFQCTLCPKRFTRAYNLRSHLRTHTDERPFVCTVCGKAFARQHDRKRHEGLHSGEKKFVCRGTLKAGANWGCGRRFARADALGRHFRSEAGRVCIRPLLDEETAERQRAQMEQQQAGIGMSMGHVPGGMEMGIAFPSALLEQYPALATIGWGNMPDTGGDYDDGDPGFDASGNEYDDGGSVSGGSAMGGHQERWVGADDGWHSDTGDGTFRPQ
jgi:hypothetical protein